MLFHYLIMALLDSLFMVENLDNKGSPISFYTSFNPLPIVGLFFFGTLLLVHVDHKCTLHP